MKRHATIAMLLLSAAAIFPVLSSDADAANIRRHLKCDPFQLPSISFLTPSPAHWALLITNTWSLTIPKGTTFTVTVDRRSSTFKSGAALGSGQSTMYGNYGGKPQSCNVSVPG